MEHLRNDVKHNNKMYYVSTNDTWDRGLETMIFEFENYEKKIINWTDLHQELYDSEEKAIAQHTYICENIHEFIE